MQTEVPRHRNPPRQLLLSAGFLLLQACGGGGGGSPPPPANQAPVFTQQPQGQAVLLGTPATFTAAASGNPAPGYQWRRNGTDIPGSTLAFHTTPATIKADHGSTFQVTAANVAGSATSAAAVLSVNWGPSISTQPADQTVMEGQPASFAVLADGNPGPSYQWRRGGADIPGAASAVYSMAAASLADNGARFSVVVSNAYGSATSTEATLHVTAAPAVFYVAPGGDDSAPGTLARPWRTLQKAAQTLDAGQTACIRGGTYREQLAPVNSGSAAAWITYTAYPGETVTVDGTGTSLIDDLAGLVDIRNVGYIRISGLRVSHARPHLDNAGIMVLGSHHVVLQGNHTYDTWSSGIGVWSSHDVVLDGNEVELSCLGGQQESISVAGSDSVEVRDCTVHDGPKEGICIKDGSSNVSVHHNQVHHKDRVGIYLDAWDKHTHDIQVFQNIARDTGNNGIAAASEMGGLLENVRIFNNLAYRNRFCGIVVTTNGPGGPLMQNPLRNIRVVNNTVWGNGIGDWGGGIVVDNKFAEQVLLRNNLVSQNLTFQIARDPAVNPANVTVDHNLIDGFRGEETEIHGTDFVEGDPRFANVAGADFHLLAGSPAIDAASPLEAPTADFDGNPRPVDGNGDGTASFDIGACEFSPSRRAAVPARTGSAGRSGPDYTGRRLSR